MPDFDINGMFNAMIDNDYQKDIYKQTDAAFAGKDKLTREELFKN